MGCRQFKECGLWEHGDGRRSEGLQLLGLLGWGLRVGKHGGSLADGGCALPPAPSGARMRGPP